MQMVRALGLAAALLAVGCSSGGNDTVLVPTGNGPNNGGLGTPTQFSLQSPAFTAGQVATVILRHTPPTQNAAEATVSGQAGRELSSDTESPRVEETAGVTETVDVGMRDMPLALQQLEAENRKNPPAPGFPGVLPRYQELAKGQDTTFFVSTANQSITARKMNEENQTVHCTIFAQVVGGSPIVGEAQALQIANAFDTNNPFLPGAGIYDQVRGLVGSEWTNGGGRDGDAKINIVLLSNQGIGGEQFFGFFRPNDEYPRSQIPDSNEAEVLFLNGTKATGDMFDLLGSLAHEFTHMITFNMKFGRQGAFNGEFENNAIDEGRATLIEELLGYGLVPPNGGQGSNFVYRVSEAFLRDPDARGLFQFSGSSDSYGRPYTLHRYLVDRYGIDAWRNYNMASGSGLDQLNTSFGPFVNTFTDWTLALVSDPLAGPVPPQHRFTGPFHPRGQYNIRGLGSRQLPGVVPSQSFGSASGSLSVNLPAWAFTTFEYTGGTGAALRVNVSASTSNVNGNILIEGPRGTFNAIR